MNTDTDIQSRSRFTNRIPSANPNSTTSGRRIQSSHALRFARPESANYVTQKLVGSVNDTGSAAGETGDMQKELKKFQDKTQVARPGTGKAKTTYQVRPKYSGRPQHITGRFTRSYESNTLQAIIQSKKARLIIGNRL